MKQTVDTQKALRQQQNEIDDYTIYSMLARSEKHEANREIFRKIAKEEQGHYAYLRSFTQKELRPRSFVVLFYLLLSKILGVSFTLKFLENREEGAK